MIYLLLLPVAVGLLLWWVIRNDNRRQFVRQRLNALTRRDVDEDAPLLERTIQQRASFIPKDVQARLDTAFAAAGNRIGPLHLAAAGLLAAVIVVAFANVVLGYGPALMTPLGVIAMGVVPILYLRTAQSRYRNRFLNLFPDALDLVRRSIVAGLPVNEALVIAAREISDPVGSELRRGLDQVQVGVPMIDALHATADRIRVPDFRFMVVALGLQQKTGGSLAETLANLSAVIRARKALRLKARALSAEAKMSAAVLAALPFMVGGAMYLLNRTLMYPMFVDPRGRFMLGIAFLSLAIGLVFMYVLVRRAVR